LSWVNESSQSALLRTRVAGLGDVDALVRLINAAFVVERHIFDGDRTHSEAVHTLLEKGKFLVLEDSAGLAGCVYVEPRGDRGYIGLLSVDPLRQGSGLGRRLMDEAEGFIRGAGCIAAELRVVSARTPLPAFYRHLGYAETHKSALPPELSPKVPCEFIYMSKTLR
jgi:GNAT superfamily N-acetyltransferase